MDFIWIVSIIVVVLSVAICILAYLIVTRKLKNKSNDVDKIIANAQMEAEGIRKTSKLDLKQELHQMRLEAQQEVAEIKVEGAKIKGDILARESAIEAEEEQIKREKQRVQAQRENLRNIEDKLEEQLEIKVKELERVSGLSSQEAKHELMNSVKEQMQKEMNAYIKDVEDEMEEKAEQLAADIISTATEKYSREVVASKTVSTIYLPSDEVKGRIIGREGRNIRSIESMTGVDVIIDDTPEAIMISCFNPVRREIAKRAIETLIEDGRIQPGAIEDAVKKSESDVEKIIMEKGRQTVYDLQLNKLPKELVKLVGTLHFRTSYGQNALLHSMEVAELAGTMAAELGQDQQLAKRAGLLHDIGKALDIENEGSHVELGAQVCRKYNENSVVINAIECHHGNKPSESVIATLITAADALSAARPGARSNTAENYIQRIMELEKVANDFKGVQKAFAIRAGREIRVMVEPGMVTDLEARSIAREIRDKIQSDLTYPGTVKVNVIRENRFEEEAM